MARLSEQVDKRSVLVPVLLGVLLASGGRPLSGDPPAGQDITAAEASQDPDLPGFLEGWIDKEQYLQLRSDALDEYRGLPYAPGKGAPANPRANAIKAMEAQQQFLKLDALTPGGLPPPNWESVGPAPIPNGQTSNRSDPVSGRTTAITVDPTDANVAYVGTAQGGVYRTLDGGATWTALFDTAQSLAIGAIAIAPSDPSIVYVGTGESHLSSDSFFGVGVYRINNAKTTADLTGPINPNVTFNAGAVITGAFTGRAISQIVVHPTDPATLFVSTATGIAGLGGTALEGPAVVPPLGVLGVYRSTNATSGSPTFQKLSLGMASMTRLFATDPTSENSRVTDLIFEPAVPDHLLAAVYGGPPQGGAPLEGGIYRSTNALAATPSFTRTLAIATNGIRIEFAINKVGPTVTVVAATGEVATGTSCTSGSGALRKSTDGGATWSAKLAGGGGFCGSQCFYDIAVAMDPNDANLVYLGGSGNSTCSRVYVRSSDGGATFAFSDDGLHADSHALAVAPSNPSIVYIGSDGGIWKSTDAAQTWTSLNNTGFNATQFQSLALHPIDREFLIGGTQDNGTQFKRPDATWFRADFGDGGFALIDQSSTDTENVTMYHTYFNQTNAMGFGRVTQASAAFEGNWQTFGCGFSGITPNGLVCTASSILFYAPLALGPSTPNTLYFGSDRLYRSADQGATMTTVSPNPIQAGVAISAIGISPQDDNVRLVGMRFGRVYATHNGSASLVNVSGPWPQSPSLAAQPRRFVSRVAIDPNNTNVAYVTFATYCGATPSCAQVYKTSNLVTALAAALLPAWTASNSGLPDVPVNAFVVDPRDSNQLFVGTDIGVYQSTNAGASWTPYGTSFPRVAVFDMALHAPSGTLRVATHGRGIWEIAVGSATPSFRALSSPAIGFGGGPTLLSGVLKAGSLVPPGSIDVTLNSITKSVPINPSTGLFSASFLTNGLAPNVYPITYTFAGAPGYNAAAGAGTLTVSASLAPTTLTLGAPTTGYPNGSVTVTVTSGAGTPAGDVSLQVDGGPPLTQTLVAGSTGFALPAVGVGTHDLLASFAAQGSFGASSATGTLTITKGTPSVTITSPTIALGQTPSVFSGTLLAGTATVPGTVDVTLDGVTQTASVNPSTGAFSSTFATSVLAAGTYSIDVTYAGDASFEAASGSGTLTVTPAFSTSTFANPGLVLVPVGGNTPGPGSPNPSVITVSGLSGTVLKATATLKGLSHTWLSDTSFLLVAPDGTTTVLLYLAGGDAPGVAGVDLTLDDAGPAVPALPPTGTYRPTQVGVVSSFVTGGSPGPDPPPVPYGTTLFTHNGTSPNGDWRLYTQDAFNGDFGQLATGWELTLLTPLPAGATIDDVTVNEGGDAVFTVTLSSPPAAGADVDFATASGTAASGSDFIPATGTIHFDPLEVTKTITVSTVADGQGEGNETFFVNLANPLGLTLDDVQGVGTITDVDPNATIGDVQKAEGNAGRTSFLFTVTLDAAPVVPVSVRYATASLGATPGRDYIHVAGVLAFAPGQTSNTISVAVVGDRVEERDEFFEVVLSNPTGGLALDRTEALGWIVNDDFVGPPKVSISDATLVEGNGSGSMVFTVRLSRVASSVLTVPYSTANGTASAGGDYTAATGIVSFPVGVTDRTIAIAILGDAVAEPDETFFVNLGPARGIAYLDRQGKGTIVNDDP